MSTSQLWTLLEGMRDDILTHAGLPTKRHVQLGAPRLVETEKNLPLLNIFASKSLPVRLTTDTYTEWNDHITVGWYTATRDAIDTGVISEADAKAHIEVAEQIEQRAILWVPTIPGLSFQNETSFDEVLRGKVRGNVLGTELKLDVRRWRE